MIPIGYTQSNAQFPLSPIQALPLTILGAPTPAAEQLRARGIFTAMFPGRVPPVSPYGPLRPSAGN